MGSALSEFEESMENVFYFGILNGNFHGDALVVILLMRMLVTSPNPNHTSAPLMSLLIVTIVSLLVVTLLRLVIV